MPFAKLPFSKGIINFNDSLTQSEISALVADPQLKVLQTCKPFESATAKMLNDELFPLRPDVELRVWGFPSAECNLSFLKDLTNVRHFSADCLLRAEGVEHIADLQFLESLSVGIYSLERFDFLERLSERRLQKLSLGATKSKQPRLRHLARFRDLRKLYIEGQEKDIEAISGLAHLEDLTLRSITVGDLRFLSDLKRLWSLDIKLGGANNLAALGGMGSIKYLELWQIRGLKDISVISTMHGLQYLFLQSLPHIRSLPDVSDLGSLRRVHLENMKGLQDIRSAAKAPALEEFVHFSAQAMKPEQYVDLLKSKTLKRIFVGFGSHTRIRAFLDQAARVGIQPFERSQFTFQ